ncbi:MAG: hypothetical protein HYS05_03335 [Acidobacteria bacterium]|nr:hypothetical protein [Acidobacteriota bacterium]
MARIDGLRPLVTTDDPDMVLRFVKSDDPDEVSIAYALGRKLIQRVPSEIVPHFHATFGRTGFRRNFAYGGTWRGERYASKQVEASAVEEGDGWPVITVIVKFFGQAGD